MLRILLIVLLVFTSSRGKANDSCSIFLNKKLLFKGQIDQQESAAYINGRKVNKLDIITIKYYSESENKGWNRTFYLTDLSEQDIKSVSINKQSGTIAVNASALEKTLEKKQPVFIYTTSIPNNKAMAARVRVRRIFICRIVWK